MPVSVDDICLRLFSWYIWMKLFEINTNWNLSLIVFLKSLLIVFSKTIGWKALGKS